jgi:hypothetical protein
MNENTMFEIEVGEDATQTRCECCNGESATGHGFVYKDGGAHAVYYVGWSPVHPDHSVTLAISVGRWDEASSQSDRTCFGVEASEDRGHLFFTFIDPESSPWPDSDLLGHMLSRDESMKNPRAPEIVRIAEAIFRDHPSLSLRRRKTEPR